MTLAYTVGTGLLSPCVLLVRCHCASRPLPDSSLAAFCMADPLHACVEVVRA